MSTRRKMILDVDTGTDDAVAMILSMMSPELEVIGVCSVNGNREVKLTTINTLRVAELLDSKVPVYRGCEYPMVATLRLGGGGGTPIREGSMISDMHGDYLALPETTWKQAETMPAACYYIDTLMNTKEKITIAAVGPLTNLAHALRIEPRICENIEEIVIMGGGYQINNDSPSAEYNVWVDPEAAEIVQVVAGEEYGVKINWVPLDATHKCYMTNSDAEYLYSLNDPIAKAVADCIITRTTGYEKDADMSAMQAAPIHDALAISYLIDPTVLKDVRHVNMHVVTGGGYADGMTVQDMRELIDKPAPNCYFALDADRDKFMDILLNAVKRGVVYSK